MSHDYINDLFGKFRKGRKTKFSDLEATAKKIMRDIWKDKITYDEFYTGFNELIVEFNELCGNVIDENTPLWFNSFSANIFLRWRDWFFLRKTYQEHPEKFNTPELMSRYKSIESMNYDIWLKEKIKYCLDNLS